jgi:hypothetical protein
MGGVELLDDGPHDCVVETGGYGLFGLERLAEGLDVRFDGSGGAEIDPIETIGEDDVGGVARKRLGVVLSYREAGIVVSGGILGDFDQDTARGEGSLNLRDRDGVIQCFDKGAVLGEFAP